MPKFLHLNFLNKRIESKREFSLAAACVDSDSQGHLVVN